VPLVEEGILKGKTTQNIIEMYLKNLKSTGADVIILGCTHYPLLKKQIASYLKRMRIVDSATEVALHAKEILSQNNLLRASKRKTGKKEFYVTDEPKAFMRLAKLFLKRNIPLPRVINNLQ
jgi:glutamate racemase